jgi:ABC-2 type transport system permease protein
MLPLAQIETLKQLKDKSLFFWTVEKNTLIPVTDCEATKVLFVLSVVNSSISNMMDFSTFIIISIVISFVKDREKGIVSRLASTPLKPYNFCLYCLS